MFLCLSGGRLHSSAGQVQPRPVGRVPVHSGRTEVSEETDRERERGRKRKEAGFNKGGGYRGVSVDKCTFHKTQIPIHFRAEWHVCESEQKCRLCEEKTKGVKSGSFQPNHFVLRLNSRFCYAAGKLHIK